LPCHWIAVALVALWAGPAAAEAPAAPDADLLN
jgi:hypothetical protein